MPYFPCSSSSFSSSSPNMDLSPPSKVNLIPTLLNLHLDDVSPNFHRWRSNLQEMYKATQEGRMPPKNCFIPHLLPVMEWIVFQMWLLDLTEDMDLKIFTQNLEYKYKMDGEQVQAKPPKSQKTVLHTQVQLAVMRELSQLADINIRTAASPAQAVSMYKLATLIEQPRVVKVYNWGGELLESENVILDGIVVPAASVLRTQLKSPTSLDLLKKCPAIAHETSASEPTPDHIRKGQKLVENAYGITKLWIGVDIDYNAKTIDAYWDGKKPALSVHTIRPLLEDKAGNRQQVKTERKTFRVRLANGESGLRDGAIGIPICANDFWPTELQDAESLDRKFHLQFDKIEQLVDEAIEEHLSTKSTNRADATAITQHQKRPNEDVNPFWPPAALETKRRRREAHPNATPSVVESAGPISSKNSQPTTISTSPPLSSIASPIPPTDDGSTFEPNHEGSHDGEDSSNESDYDPEGYMSDVGDRIP